MFTWCTWSVARLNVVAFVIVRQEIVVSMTKDADYKPVMQDENIFRPGDTGTANLTEPERMKATLTAFNTIFSRSSNSADFYQETARFLSAAYNATFAFIGLFDDPDNPREISSIAASAQGEVISNFSFPLEGSPTQDVLNLSAIPLCPVAPVG